MLVPVEVMEVNTGNHTIQATLEEVGGATQSLLPHQSLAQAMYIFGETPNYGMGQIAVLT